MISHFVTHNKQKKVRLLLIMAKKSSKRKTVEFQQKWVVKYGIRVSARDTAYGKVCSVECRFCRHFGRDDRSNPGEKRKRTSHIKMFTAPWRSDHILFHMNDQHPDQFKTYSELPDAQKKEYFPTADEGGSSPFSPRDCCLTSPTTSSIAARFFRRPVATDTHLNFFIDKSIVEGIIGDLLFDPDPASAVVDELVDDVEAVHQRVGLVNYHTRQRFLSEFTLQEVDTPANEGDQDCDEEEQLLTASIEAADQSDATASTFDTGAPSIDGRPGKEAYVANVPSKVQFYSCVKMVSSGLSFRQTSRVMHDMKETLGIPSLGSVSPQRVSSFIRIVCASNLQTIGTMLRSAWAFSIALDGGNKSDTSYLDVRIRVCIQNRLHNLHVIAIPMRERHTGENMFNLVSTTLDNLAPDWRNRIISVTTDGASSMTGQRQGIASRLQNVALPGFYRVWCAIHQLDLVLQKLYNSLCDDSFVGTMTSMTGHLRRQFNLIAQMGSKCPRFVETRWMSMTKVLKWLMANRVPVEQHLQSRNVDWVPSGAWWITSGCLCRVMKLVDVAIVKLQGRQLQLAMQREILAGLSTDLCKLGSVQGPLTDLEMDFYTGSSELSFGSSVPDEVDPNQLHAYCVWKEKYVMTLDNALSFAENCGSFVLEQIQELLVPGATDEGRNMRIGTQVLSGIAFMFVDLVCGIDAIEAERDNANRAAGCDSSNSLSNTFVPPPATPWFLQNLSNRDFSMLIRQHRQRLQQSKSRLHIHQLEELFDDFKHTLHSVPQIKEAVNNEKEMGTFEEAWAMFDAKFDPLKDFFGGLGSVFPGTATVESDFSLINWEKDEYRSWLTDLSLEGILHSKQYFDLQNVVIS